MAADLDRAHALIDALCGEPDAAAIRAVDVLHAQAAALAWVREVTCAYPAPAHVAERLQAAADELRVPGDERNPHAVLIQVAAAALDGGASAA